MHPSFEQFVAALHDPSQRTSIGLAISDADAAVLLTRADWANDYYSRWVALFPVASAAHANAAAIQAPTAAALTSASPAAAFANPSVSDFGPPPRAVASQFDVYSSQLTPTRSRMPRGLRTPLIIGVSVLVAVSLVVVGVAVYSGLMANAATQHAAEASHQAAGASPSTSADPLPADLHGLSAREYPLMEAVFESQDRTIPEMAAQGMTDDRIRTLTDTIVPEAETACTDAQRLQNGFDDPSYKSSFIAGYISTSHVTPDKAEAVYQAIADYCHSD